MLVSSLVSFFGGEEVGWRLGAGAETERNARMCNQLLNSPTVRKHFSLTLRAMHYKYKAVNNKCDFV